MTLLEEIQNSAIDGSADLGTLLRKCKLLAARLGSRLLEDWLLWESNGYPDEVAVPDYRRWSLELKGHFSGPFQSGLRNAPIPLALLPERIRKAYQNFECRESVANIETMLKANESGTIQITTGDLALYLGTNVYRGQNCLQAWAVCSISHLIELLNSVRNRVLDFSIAVWKENPLAGEIQQSGRPPAIESAKITQIFQTTVYGGSTNLVGTSDRSTIAFNVGGGDFSSVERILLENHASKEDIEELRSGLLSEPHQSSPETYGPKVSSWISKMTKKAAEGTWKIGVAAACELLPKLIAKYYGPQ